MIDGEADVVAWGLVLLAYTGLRTLRPIRYRSGSLASIVRVAGDVALATLAVVATGFWDSPYIFSLVTAVVIAGFAQGFGFAFRMAVTAALAVSLPLGIDTDWQGDGLRESAEWSAELLMVALVAGYGRRLFGEAEERHSLALDRMSRLAEANTLLFSLHRIAQTLPASLDLGEAVESTVARLRDLFSFESAAVLIRDETTESWVMAAREGLRVEHSIADAELVPPLSAALRSPTTITVADLRETDAPGGLSGSARSGLYAALRARGAVVGLLALEHASPDHFRPRDRELLEGFIEPAALAIDNARWFSRLRTVGADEERTRIARDLHDRIGQSIAYIAFELDRITKRAEKEPVLAELNQLRQDVRTVVTEVRETLYDLRTDVSDQQDLVSILTTFLERVRDRSGIEVEFHHEMAGRLPLPQERELWRIAQEAIVNAERHAKPARIRVRWSSDGRRALLEVSDDGKGFPVGGATRIDAYGMLGMRERADAVGASLEVESEPGRGTIIRCRLQRT